MSGSGPKTKDTDKIKFFKVDEGDIAPAFPKENAPQQSEGQTFSRIEPIFQPLPPAEPPAPPEPIANEPLTPEPGTVSSIAPVVPNDAQLEVQIDLLKPQIDSIARLPEAEDLSGDQVEVLRKYISLKKAEVRDLRDQQRQYQEVLKRTSSQLESTQRRNTSLLTEHEALKRELDSLKKDLREIRDRHHDEIAVLKNDYEERLKQGGNIDVAAQEFYRKRDEWKEKIKEELKRIKLKERELENKYELLKRDTQALLDSKDKHLLELKKKLDAMELEQETLEDRLRKATTVIATIESKKKRLIETMKLSISLLEAIDSVTDTDDKEKKAG